MQTGEESVDGGEITDVRPAPRRCRETVGVCSVGGFSNEPY